MLFSLSPSYSLHDASPLLDLQNYNYFQAFIGLPYPRLDNPLIYEDDMQIEKNYYGRMEM